MSNNTYHIMWDRDHDVPRVGELESKVADNLDITKSAVDVSRIDIVGEPPKDEIGIQTRTMPREHIKQKIKEVSEEYDN